MKTKETEFACINKCARGFYVRLNGTSYTGGTEAIADFYCFDKFDDAVAFIKERMGAE